MNILITGATGNIGKEVIRSIETIQANKKIVASVSNIERAKSKLEQLKIDEYRKIDFQESANFNTALKSIDIVFLLRPPQIADIEKFFVPFFETMKQKGIRKIVFLSVQGVETQKKIPHYKMEQTIREYGFEYVFLRPSYFMQNLTTTLLPDIKTRNRIFIPAGNLRMNWVDALDIGMVGAKVLIDFEKYKNREIEITGSEFLGFNDAAFLLSQATGRQISYKSPNLLKFYFHMRKLGTKPAMIFVMIMLHYLPRFSKNEERLVDSVKQITGSEPQTLKEFVKRELQTFS